MTRHEIRENVFKLIFEQLVRGDSLEELYLSEEESEILELNEEVKRTAEGIVAHAEEIDGIIQKYSKSRTVGRISRVNLSILRIAVYESLYDEEVPVNVAVSEAIKLSSEYAYKEDTAFINGLLGAFSRDFLTETAEKTENE